MKDCTYALLLIIVAAISTFATRATSFMPVVTNFSAHEYTAGLQNWSCVQGPNGDMYIGNNTGLLRYDGYTWEKFDIPGCPIARAVFADGDRVYVGSYHEFGYFKRNEYGEMIFTSLHDQIKGVERNDYDIWNILKVNGIVYFQSFSSWFSYDGKKVTSHFDPNMLPLYFHKVGNTVYVQMINGDFYQLVGEKFRFVFSRKLVGNDNVVAILPLRGGKMLLCTEWHGLFTFDGKKVERFATEVDADLYSKQINRVTMMRRDSTIVIGTILNGIYAISQQGRLLWNLNIGNRLHNNSVLRLFTDRDDNIWAGLDNGVSLIHTGSPYMVLIPDIYSAPLGMVYGLDWVGDNMYIATNIGAYRFSGTKHTITPINSAKGQNWHITHFDTDQIFSGHLQTKIIVGDNAVPISDVEASGSTSMQRCNVYGQDVLLESSYIGLRVYRKVGGKWVFSNKIEGIDMPLRQFEVDFSGTIWAAHMSRGLYRIKLNPSLTRVTQCTSISDMPGGFKGGTMFVMKILGRVMFANRNKLYTYDDVHNKIVSVDYLNRILDRNINSATAIDDHNVWLSSDYDYLLVHIDGNRAKVLNIVSAQFFGSECNETNNKTFIHNGDVYFLLNNAIGRSGNLHIPKPLTKSRLYINRVYSLGRDKAVHAMPTESGRDLYANANGAVTFELSFPHFDNSMVRFRYHLSGNGLDLQSESPQPSITYNSLGYGDYHFTASLIDNDGKASGSIDYYFSIPRPFYLSFFAIVIYIALIVAITWFITRRRAAIVLEKRRKEFEVERAKQDLKMMEQQHIIDRQQQQLLEAELSNKGKEIASLALDVFNKDRAIESLREIVGKRKSGGKSPQAEIDSLMKQIDTTNLQNKEFWDLYQANFDLIHENFFRNLRSRYPQLTSSDLKFCAFLRLNLSTKDIANLTHLTVRGVEAARYRLRRKLALPEGASLVDFFIDFK